MANASTTGFGLRAAMRLGNTPAIEGQSSYAIKDNTGVGLFKGNPVSLEDSSGDKVIYKTQVSQQLMIQVEAELISLLELKHY